MARVKIYHERQNRKETKMQCNLAVIKGDGKIGRASCRERV